MRALWFIQSLFHLYSSMATDLMVIDDSLRRQEVYIVTHGSINGVFDESLKARSVTECGIKALTTLADRDSQVVKCTQNTTTSQIGSTWTVSTQKPCRPPKHTEIKENPNRGVCFNAFPCSSLSTEFYKCSCKPFSGLKWCYRENKLARDLFIMCSSLYRDTFPRYGSNVYRKNFRWRCFERISLTPDTNLYKTEVPGYFSAVGSTLKGMVDAQMLGKYFYANYDQSCQEHCSEKGKTVSCELNTLNSLYSFAVAGVTCNPHFNNQDEWSSDMHPYVKSNKCHGFLYVPPTYNCLHGKQSDLRRLCRCL